MNMNDPEWGRRPDGDAKPENEPGDNNGRNRPQSGQNSPPDLDELWQEFNQRIGRLLGKPKGWGNGPGGPRGPGGPSGSGGSPSNPFNSGNTNRAVGMGLLAGVLIWLASGFHIVQEGSEGVVLQFGEFSHTEPAGFRWRLPYPIQSHEIVNTSQVRIIEVGYRNDVKNKITSESLMLTEDENIIDIQFAVQYRLKDSRAYLFNTADPDEAVKMAAETAIREVVGANGMDFVLYEGREQVALDTAKVMQSILDRYQTGILVSSVAIGNAQPPEQVQAAFDDAVKAGQDRERLKNDGQAYANDVIPRAKGNAARLLEEARGYQERVVAQAEGDAARFTSVLTEYAKAPKVMRDRMYIDTMQEVFSNVTKVIVDSKNTSPLLYLPFDKLMEKSGSPAAGSMTANPLGQTGAAGAVPATNATRAADPMSADAKSTGSDADALREALRNRDRGAR